METGLFIRRHDTINVVLSDSKLSLNLQSKFTAHDRLSAKMDNHDHDYYHIWLYRLFSMLYQTRNNIVIRSSLGKLGKATVVAYEPLVVR